LIFKNIAQGASPDGGGGVAAVTGAGTSAFTLKIC